MTIKKYKTKIEIDIVPEYHASLPTIVVGIDSVEEKKIISQNTTLTFDTELSVGEHSVIIDFVDKTNADCVPSQNLDKTISITNIRINGICLDRFLWESTYTPNYPEPWYSQQTVLPPQTHKGSVKLGWNGRWQLNFTSPVFTWIHQTEKMGWIWPINP
jgi:hypothetical protein